MNELTSPLFLSLLTMIGAFIVGCMTPGPSFLLVARTSVADSRTGGLAVSLGMGVGGVVYALAALAGLQTLLQMVPTLYTGICFAGGVYLAYVGWHIWSSAKKPLTVDAVRIEKTTLLRSFNIGLATQLSNPKTALAYAGIFAALLPPDMPVWLLCLLPVIVFVIETGWYAVVALVLSSERPRQAYLQCKSGIDRFAGAVIFAIGVRLFFAGFERS